MLVMLLFTTSPNRVNCMCINYILRATFWTKSLVFHTILKHDFSFPATRDRHHSKGPPSVLWTTNLRSAETQSFHSAPRKQPAMCENVVQRFSCGHTRVRFQACYSSRCRGTQTIRINGGGLCADCLRRWSGMSSVTAVDEEILDDSNARRDWQSR